MGRVLLFDIDGTLLSTQGVGRRAMREAFDAFCGVPTALDNVSFGGMTDRGLARLGLQAASAPDTEEAIDGLLECYIGCLTRAMVDAPPCIIHPGVHDILEKVSGVPGVAVGVATGNIEAGAMQKLRHGGLDHWFAFGGYGSDHEIRAELLRAGWHRGAAQLGKDPEACDVVVIGDTPRDVSAAHAIGALCITVTTGTYDADALHQAGADQVVVDLTDPRVPGWLLGEGA